MSKAEVEIIVDSREPDGVVETLVLHEDIKDFEVKELPEGDIIVEDCIFERKTPSDFASSVEDGRMREQIEMLAGKKKEGMSPHILIEGDMSDFAGLKHTNMPAKSLRGMVAAIIERNKIPVTFCSTPEYVADMAVRLARKDIEPASVEAKQTGAVKEATFIEKLFMAVDGIGYQTATELASHFESPTMVVRAGKEDFKKAEGVGEKTAEEIVNTLQGEDEEETEENKPRSFTI